MRRAGALGCFGLLLWACATARNPVIYREDLAGLMPGAWTSGVHCQDSRECPERSYCARLGCDGPGGCQAMPEITNDVSRPVCGCDGRSYGNDDAAHQARVSVSHELRPGEWSGRVCEPHFVCRDREQHPGVVCPTTPR